MQASFRNNCSSSLSVCVSEIRWRLIIEVVLYGPTDRYTDRQTEFTQTTYCRLAPIFLIWNPNVGNVYLAGIRHMQIAIGLPDPKGFSSMPRLKLVQSGIQRYTSQQHTNTGKIRLPITPTILQRIRDYWLPKSEEPDIKIPWAAVVICFFGFRSGEITVPSVSSFDLSSHLAWSDVSLDNVLEPTTLKIHLKRSKTDQLKKGVDVYIGRTGCSLCPVGAGVDYMSI